MFGGGGTRSADCPNGPDSGRSISKLLTLEDKKMRWIALIAFLAIVLMFLGGWLYFTDGPTQSELIIDKQEAQQDTKEIVDVTQKALQEAAEDLKGIRESTEEAVTDDKTSEEERTAPNPARSL
jgi:hypothetical protein